MSCSIQPPEDRCCGQSDQEVAMSLLIPACLLHMLPKEVLSARGTLTISPQGFRRYIPQPWRNTSRPAPFPLHQKCHRSHHSPRECIMGSGRAGGSCKPVPLPRHKPLCSGTAHGEHPHPSKEDSECRAR